MCWACFHVLACHVSVKCQVFYPFFGLFTYFLITEFWEFFVYPGYKVLIRYMICKYFFPVCLFFLLFFFNHTYELQKDLPYLLILLTVCFKKQFLILMKFSVAICSFMGYAFGITFKKALPNPSSQRLSPTFSCRIFMVLGFTFRYVIHFDLIFVCDARCESKFLFFA